MKRKISDHRNTLEYRSSDWPAGIPVSQCTHDYVPVEGQLITRCGRCDQVRLTDQYSRYPGVPMLQWSQMDWNVMWSASRLKQRGYLIPDRPDFVFQWRVERARDLRFDRNPYGADDNGHIWRYDVRRAEPNPRARKGKTYREFEAAVDAMLHKYDLELHWRDYLRLGIILEWETGNKFRIQRSLLEWAKVIEQRIDEGGDEQLRKFLEWAFGEKKPLRVDWRKLEAPSPITGYEPVLGGHLAAQPARWTGFEPMLGGVHVK